jgi:hypothetical protein
MFNVQELVRVLIKLMTVCVYFCNEMKKWCRTDKVKCWLVIKGIQHTSSIRRHVQSRQRVMSAIPSVPLLCHST